MKLHAYALTPVLLALALGAAPVWAQGPLSTLEAQASAEVENDEMTVTLTVRREGAQAHELSQSVLADVQLALARVRKAPTVTPAMGGVQTYPQWGPNGKTKGWTVTASLVLTSRDFPALGLLASELTQHMQLTGVSFALSQEARVKTEQVLMADLAKNFEAKSRTLTQVFGYRTYELRTLNFTGQPVQESYPMPQMAMSMRMDANAAVPVPSEGGKSRVSVAVVGTVELSR